MLVQEGVCRFRSCFKVVLKRITMFFEGVELPCVLKDMLVLHDDVQHDQARRAWGKITSTLVILVLTEEQLCLLRVV
jgi:hypothetical protein